jgi:exopolysaccharide production protein ExoZ
VAISANKLGQFAGVQALRGAASLLVVANHASAVWSERLAPTSGPPAFLRGSFGVDLFFVISGFVMAVFTTSFAKRPDAAAEFLKRRLIRILPLYWLVTLIKVTVACIYPRLTIHQLPSVWNIVASLFLIPTRLTHGLIGVVVSAGWTLSLELVFYLFFAIALKLRRPPLQVLLPTLGVVATIGFFNRPSWPPITYLANPLTLEFLAGVVLGTYRATLASVLPLPARWLLLLFSTVTICYALYSIAILGEPPLAMLLRMSIWGAASLCLVASVVLLESQIGRLLPNLALAIGDASYSIYLWQTLLLPALAILLLGLRLDRLSLGYLICTVLSLVVCILGGLLSFRLLDRPATEWLRLRISRLSRPILTITAP